MSTSRYLIAFLALSSVATMASAGDLCNVPQSEWQPEKALKTELQAQGWKVRQVKVENGCYEAYAINDSGKRMEALFNPKTLKMVSGEDED